jgi:hypothetical protein
MLLKGAPGMVCAGMVIGALLAFLGKSFAASLIEDLPVKSVLPILFGAVAMIAVALRVALPYPILSSVEESRAR